MLCTLKLYDFFLEVIWVSIFSYSGHAMAQAVSRWPLTMEARVHTWVSPCGICGWQSGTGTGFSLRVIRFSPVNINPPLLHTHLSPPHQVCDSPDQAAHYHTLSTKLGASCLTWHLSRTEERSISLIFSNALKNRVSSGSSVWLQAGRPGDQGSIPGRGRGFFL
jgi:hypothetical protein